MSDITINSLPTASTIDGSLDILPIYTASSAATQGISRNTLLNIASNPVGISDSQTLANKTITAPTISSPVLSGTLTGTYTIGGTPTFPSSVVTLTGSQTLTNKILTSPTINSPTITNATISTDAITGFSSANSGTLYGISIASSQITSNMTMTGTLTVSGLVTGNAGLTISAGTTQLLPTLKNPYKFRVYRNAAQNTSSGVFTVLLCDTKLFDTGTNVDVATNKGRFTAPIAGFYQFQGSGGLATSSGTTNVGAALYKNGSVVSIGSVYGSTGGNSSIYSNVSDILQLSANDYVELYVYCNATAAIDVGSTKAWFSGFLVSAT